MYFDDAKVMRSRSTDPATSHAAAKKAERFIPTHKAQILEALIEGPRTAQGIAAMTGLTVVQVDRRLCELERAERIEYVATEDGQSVSVGGYRVLKLKGNDRG
jgi:predicted Rossmann fold nucleotide-binding protein DprA/Smf involved in DNA uptake